MIPESGQVNASFEACDEKISFRNNNRHHFHRVEWKDLEFTIVKKEMKFVSAFGVKFESSQKLILRQQSGFIESGTMTALMGPSGAGKTTLLNVITGRCDAKFLSGSIMFVSSNQDQDKKLKLSYVPQKDYLHSHFSIRETFIFAFKFYAISSGKFVTSNLIKEKVDKLASNLNLTSALDTKIAQCSGGQVKRVSVAVELLSNPDILILDEPTSGLDSFNASVIISVIKDMLKSASTRTDDINYHSPPAVICAIHQPSSETFNLFDQIYALSDGKNIFSGPPHLVPNFLSANKIILGTVSNPADYLLMLCQSEEEIRTMHAVKNDVCDIVLTDFHHLMNVGCKNPNFFPQIMLLMRRQLLMLVRNPSPILIRSLFCLLSTVLLYSMFNHVVGDANACYDHIFGFDDPPNDDPVAKKLVSSNLKNLYQNSLMRMNYALDNVSFLIMSCVFLLIVHSFMALVEIPFEIMVISKEVSNHWYSINAFLTARLFITFSLIAIHVSFFVWFTMRISNQRIDFDQYLLITVSWTMLAWTSELVGFCIGAMFHKNLAIAVLVQVLQLFPQLYFCGFCIKPYTTHYLVERLTWISQLKHVFYSMMIVVFGRESCSQNPDKLSFPMFLEMSPLKIMSYFMASNNVTDKLSNTISPILGLPDNEAMAQVINATRDYYGIEDAGNTIEDDYNLNVQIENIDELSFVLSMFGIKEEFLAKSYLFLGFLLAAYLILSFSVMIRMVKIRF